MEQQEKMSEFEQYNYLWGQLVDENTNNPNIGVMKEEINSGIKMIRKTDNPNVTLIQSFLFSIRKVLKQTDTNIINSIG